MHLDLQVYYFRVRLRGLNEARETSQGTLIEQIFREVMGRKMPPAVKRILYRNAEPDPSRTHKTAGGLAMTDEEWIKTLADGRRVKFTHQELPAGRGVFLTAQTEGNKVVYSIVLTRAKPPLRKFPV